MSDTIYALSSGAGRAGLAVIRLSGPLAAKIVQALTRMDVPQPRCAVRRTFRPAVGDGTLDEGLLIWFPGPRSFTGEDVAEFHVHGGPAVVAAMLAALSACAGTRVAEPGEFTKRGFLNGKMDLTAAEGVADLIEAETEAQRRQAQRQAAGGGIVAALGVTQEFRTLDILLRELDRADAELRTCDGERRYFASILLGWGDA